MTRKKVKFSHTKWLLPLWILLIGSIVLYMIAHAVQQDDSRHIRTLAELNAVTYGDNMIADLNAGINITDTLEQILISTDGRIDKFDIIADRMMADYVRSIQVAPGGIVTDIYPAEGNEAGKIDLIHDKYRGETVKYSIANDALIIHGPFELEQGGHVLSIRNPVFLQDEKGTPYFWGMTMVIIKVPDIFQHSADALTNFGYQYRLSKTISPLTDEYTVVDQSEETLTDPVSYDFTLGGCNWRLEIMPTGGWKNGTLLQLIVLCGIALYEVKLQGKHGALAYRPDFHNSKRTQLGFSLSDISDNLPGAFFIYRAEKEDERILYANQEMLQLTGCTDLDDFMHFTKHQFRNLVHPEDLTQVEESIWQQIESGMNGYNDYVKYRLAVKDGTYKTVLDYGRIVESEHYGSVFYVLVVDCEFIKTHYDD